MTIRIAIVEDEEAPRLALLTCLERFGKEKGLALSLSTFSDALSLLDHYEPIYDLIFMDIQLPYLNGMDAARRLRAMDQSVLLVFVTNLTQYAIAGYEVAALDYILKP
ncbi:MAG: response regulator, partial [Blautia sp.]|nr:response regulator [Blautia sp.]